MDAAGELIVEGTGQIDSALLEALYDTALVGGDWTPALERSAVVLASAEVSLAALDHAGIMTLESTRRLLGEEARTRYESHYCRLDPKVRFVGRPGRQYLFNDSAHFDDAFVARDPFYQEYTRWVGSRHTLDTAVASTDAAPVYFAAMRTERQGRYQRASERTFAELARHFGRVQGLKTRLDTAQSALRHAESALDRLAFGIVVLDRALRVTLANAAAARLMSSPGEIGWRRGRLTARSPALDRQLQGLIERCRDGADPVAAALRIPRPGAPDLALWVVRLGPASPLAPPEGGVLVLLGDSQPPRGVSPGDLMELYGLSPAEAELALALASGRTLGEAAHVRGVRLSTARSQLLGVLAKMGLHRQVDVARVIVALPGAALSAAGDWL